MNPSRAFRPAAVLLAGFLLSACSVQNDGAMFQRWAETVRSIPVDEHTGDAPPMKVEVVDPLGATEHGGLRAAASLARPVLEHAAAQGGGLRPAKSVAELSAEAATVQIAAFRTEAEARAAWARLTAAHAALAQLEPRFESVNLGERGDWVRLKAGPVTTPEAAAALCAAAGVADAWCARASAS